jgi:hypothetical protein
VAVDRVQSCVVPSGQGEPYLHGATCAAGERCGVVAGRARCSPTSDACVEGRQRCFDANRLQLCGANGLWTSQACANGCVNEEFGSHCRSAVALTNFTGFLKYEGRSPNANYTDWSTTTTLQPALGPLLLVVRGQEILSSSFVLTDGSFTIEVPATPTAEDYLVALALRTRPGGLDQGFDYALYRPAMAAGTHDPSNLVPRTAALWEWSFALLGRASGTDFVITHAMGSGAAHILRQLRNTHTTARNVLAGTPTSLAVWYKPDVTWTCGACHFLADVPTPFGQAAAHVVIPGGPDEGHWSSAVIDHEAGHWAMAAYSADPTEGGPHSFGCVSPAGMAYSEGFATYFSSHVRQNPVYYDKQQGGFFWFDISDRTNAGTVPWPRPTPAGGLLQPLYENEVSAMLWGIRTAAGVDPNDLVRALERPELNRATFGRNYTAHFTTNMGNNCEREVVDTGIPAPCVADYLDALRCLGVSAAAVDSATQPATFYPFPANAPLCVGGTP